MAELMNPLQPAPEEPPKPVEIQEENVSDSDESDTDYPRLFNLYQVRFNEVYMVSQKLFQTERAQRQTLNHYQRRNNALLDLLARLEDPSEIAQLENLDDNSIPDKERIANIMALNPRVAPVLQSLLADEIEVKPSHTANLMVSESVTDLVSDDLAVSEVNPQSSEVWVRRNQPNMVQSKFKPLELKPTGVRDTFESTSKRRRKKD